jgi:hypothetical protein
MTGLKAGHRNKYPNLWRWVAEYGTLEVGHCYMTKSFIRALDAGGLVWKGKAKYPSLEAAMTDAEAGIARFMEQPGL